MKWGEVSHAPQALERLGAFQPGHWNIIDGWLFEKTLNLSGNSLSGPLPAWALQKMAADVGLTVKLQVGLLLHSLLFHNLHIPR